MQSSIKIQHVLTYCQCAYHFYDHGKLLDLWTFYDGGVTFATHD